MLINAIIIGIFFFTGMKSEEAECVTSILVNIMQKNGELTQKELVSKEQQVCWIQLVFTSRPENFNVWYFIQWHSWGIISWGERFPFNKMAIMHL